MDDTVKNADLLKRFVDIEFWGFAVCPARRKGGKIASQYLICFFCGNRQCRKKHWRDHLAKFNYIGNDKVADTERLTNILMDYSRKLSKCKWMHSAEERVIKGLAVPKCKQDIEETGSESRVFFPLKKGIYERVAALDKDINLRATELADEIPMDDHQNNQDIIDLEHAELVNHRQDNDEDRKQGAYNVPPPYYSSEVDDYIEDYPYDKHDNMILETNITSAEVREANEHKPIIKPPSIYSHSFDIHMFTEDEVDVSVFGRKVKIDCKREVSATGVIGGTLNYSIQLPLVQCGPTDN